jgi:hypothetical protein
MAALSEIWRATIPGAVLLSPAGASVLDPDPEVGWVRVLRARVPAFDALEPADLAIVPEAAVAALAVGALEPAVLVDELRRNGVPAMVLVGEPAFGSPAGVPQLPGPAGAAVIEAARARPLPLLWLAQGDPAAIERSMIGFLVNRRAELDRQAGRLVAEIERLALEGQGIEELAGAIGAFLSRAVAVENQTGGAVVIHAPQGVPEAAGAVKRYLANPRAVSLRVDLPGGGTLALLGPAPPTDLEREAAMRAAPLLALELSRGAAIRRAQDAARAGDRLPTQGPPWVMVLGRQILPGEELSLEERARRRDLVAGIAGPDRLTLRGDLNSLEYRVVAAPAPDDPLGLVIAARVAETIGRPVAVSRPFREATGRPAAEGGGRGPRWRPRSPS